jgi:hypothetical protein
MSRSTAIRTTIPPRTYGAGRKSKTPHALLLRMSYLELERQRGLLEIEQLQARTIKLRSRIEEIEREKAVLSVALEARTAPLAAAVPGSHAAARLSTQSRPRGGFAIRY